MAAVFHYNDGGATLCRVVVYPTTLRTASDTSVTCTACREFLSQGIRTRSAPKPPPPQIRRGPSWKTGDGREVLIADMEDDHVINALLYMERRHPSGRRKIDELREEINRRGVEDRLEEIRGFRGEDGVVARWRLTDADEMLVNNTLDGEHCLRCGFEHHGPCAAELPLHGDRRYALRSCSCGHPHDDDPDDETCSVCGCPGFHTDDDDDAEVAPAAPDLFTALALGNDDDPHDDAGLFGVTPEQIAAAAPDFAQAVREATQRRFEQSFAPSAAIFHVAMPGVDSEGVDSEGFVCGTPRDAQNAIVENPTRATCEECRRLAASMLCTCRHPLSDHRVSTGCHQRVASTIDPNTGMLFTPPCDCTAFRSESRVTVAARRLAADFWVVELERGGSTRIAERMVGADAQRRVSAVSTSMRAQGQDWLRARWVAFESHVEVRVELANSGDYNVLLVRQGQAFRAAGAARQDRAEELANDFRRGAPEWLRERWEELRSSATPPAAPAPAPAAGLCICTHNQEQHPNGERCRICGNCDSFRPHGVAVEEKKAAVEEEKPVSRWSLLEID